MRGEDGGGRKDWNKMEVCCKYRGYFCLTSPSNPYIWFMFTLSWLPAECVNRRERERERERDTCHHQGHAQTHVNTQHEIQCVYIYNQRGYICTHDSDHVTKVTTLVGLVTLHTLIL